MSAIATKKPTGDYGVQLTFPAFFQQHFSAGYAYFPTDSGTPMDLMVGTTFQSEYHEEKRADAIQSRMNGLQARKTAERKLLTGPHNYHVPKPVLSQRRFASPSGVTDGASARRDGGVDAPYRLIEVGEMVGSGMRGGVMTSLEGQDFYRRRLDERIGELDRINQVSMGYTVPMGQSSATYDNTKEGSSDKIELFIYLRALSDSIIMNDLSKFSFENLRQTLKLLFATAPSASIEDMNDMKSIVNTMVENIRDGLEPEQQKALDEEYILTVQIFLTKMSQYVAEMIRNIYMSDIDKKTLSKSLIKSLGFSSLIIKSTPQGVVEEERKTNERVNQEAEDFDDDDTDGKFTRPAQTREDEEALGIERTPFAGRSDDPNRARYGERTGRVIHGVATYFGEDARNDGEVREVNPLGLSDFDANAEIPEADTSSLKEALEKVIEDIKYDTLSITPDDAGKDIQTLLTEKDIDERVFIKEIEDSMLASGHSKPQIAKAMQLSGLALFNDYIADNLSEGLVPRQRPNIRPTGLEVPIMRMEQGGLPTTLSQLEGYTTKREVIDLWKSIPADRKIGIATPHGNTSIGNWKKRIAQALRI